MTTDPVTLHTAGPIEALDARRTAIARGIANLTDHQRDLLDECVRARREITETEGAMGKLDALRSYGRARHRFIWSDGDHSTAQLRAEKRTLVGQVCR